MISNDFQRYLGPVIRRLGGHFPFVRARQWTGLDLDPPMVAFWQGGQGNRCYLLAALLEDHTLATWTRISVQRFLHNQRDQDWRVWVLRQLA